MKIENKSYVISKCLSQTLENRLGLNLSASTRGNLEALEQQYIDEFKEYISPDINYVSLDYNQIKQPILSQIVKDDNPVISLDDIYFNEKDTPAVTDAFSITRTVDIDDPFGETKLESRNGFPSKEDQLESLAEKYANKNVSLVDVGIFSGETLVSLIKDLNQYKINVDKVYVAICGNNSLRYENGKNYFNNGFEGDVEIITNSKQNYEFEDWLELRDMVWIDGRTINTQGLDGCDESRIFIPYKEKPGKFMSICNENIENVIKLGDKYFDNINNVIRKDGYQLSLEKIDDNVSYEMKISKLYD